MKLYYAPGACSIGIHILLEEIGKPFEVSLVDTKNNAQYSPEYMAVNPKSKVPALDLGDGGPVLTEFTAIATYLGLANPEANLIPKDALGQARAIEAVDYITGTVHPHAFTRQFRPHLFSGREEDYPKAVEQARANAEKYFGVVEKLWAGDTWVLPHGFSIADAALFFVAFWQAKRVRAPLPAKVERHLDAMLARPSVQRVLQKEGLSA